MKRSALQNAGTLLMIAGGITFAIAGLAWAHYEGESMRSFQRAVSSDDYLRDLGIQGGASRFLALEAAEAARNALLGVYAGGAAFLVGLVWFPLGCVCSAVDRIKIVTPTRFSVDEAAAGAEELAKAGKIHGAAEYVAGPTGPGSREFTPIDELMKEEKSENG